MDKRFHNSFLKLKENLEKKLLIFMIINMVDL